MHEKPPVQPADDRRDYFRIEDQVALRYVEIDEDSAIHQRVPEAFTQDIGFSLIRELQRIDRDHVPQLRAIAEDNRDLETYLKALNEKIELIASHIAAEHNRKDTKEQQTVSLSEGGIAFTTEKALAHESDIALQLTLLPSHTTLILFGRVISSSPRESGSGFTTGLYFRNLSDDDRQILARHIMQVQLAQRRQSHDKL